MRRDSSIACSGFNGVLGSEEVPRDKQQDKHEQHEEGEDDQECEPPVHDESKCRGGRGETEADGEEHEDNRRDGDPGAGTGAGRFALQLGLCESFLELRESAHVCDDSQRRLADPSTAGLWSFGHSRHDGLPGLGLDARRTSIRDYTQAHGLEPTDSYGDASRLGATVKRRPGAAAE